MKIGLHWFRRDLRLTDNTALLAATAACDVVVPLFIVDPGILHQPDIGARRVAFILECVRLLAGDIAAARGKLIVRHGPVEEELRAVLRESGAHALYYNRAYEPYERKRDEAVEKLGRELGVEVHHFKDGMIHEPGEVLKDDGKPYQVFTPYRRAWSGKPLPQVGQRAVFRPSAPIKVKSVPLPSLRELGFTLDIELPPVGETEALKQLGRFAESALHGYARQRDFPAREGTSRLSPHLKFGTLSPRQVVAAAQAQNAEADAETFVGEIVWRDFYRQILWHYPHAATTSYKPQYADLKWENNERWFQAWREGRTGVPIVDAGMRQLNATGWMHNRVRMIVASYLTKDLLVSWQWGERYFMQQLFDGDLASNNGGWQWSASTGTDAQPYFRIFNPTAQAQKFDPEGVYIHRYVPEADLLTYPAPIVDHAAQRLKALALFKP